VFKALTIRSGLVRRLVAWTIATPMSVARSAKVLGQVFAPEPVPRDFATKGGGLLGLRPSQFLSASDDLQALPEIMPTLQARYGELAVPLTVLYGKQDALLDWRVHGQALVDKVPGASLQLVEGGHMLLITQPEATEDFIRAAATARGESLAMRVMH
jgi:pimeloyl-ACP methyl ester carboxylesterase